jgi:hypothetical protein
MKEKSENCLEKSIENLLESEKILNEYSEE